MTRRASQSWSSARSWALGLVLVIGCAAPERPATLPVADEGPEVHQWLTEQAIAAGDREAAQRHFEALVHATAEDESWWDRVDALELRVSAMFGPASVANPRRTAPVPARCA